MRQPLDEQISVVRTRLASLFDLDNLPPDEPVGVDHGRVDRSRNMGLRRFENRRDTLVQRLFPRIRQIGHTKRLIRIACGRTVDYTPVTLVPTS